MTRVQIGVALPIGLQTKHTLPAFTRHVEALRFDSIWVIDVLRSATQSIDCLTALSFMAAHSSSLRLGTSVFQLPLRNPVLTAKTLTSLDLLSAGRITFGVGIGQPASHIAFGCDPRTRGQRFEEGLVLLKELWTRDSVTHRGEFYQLENYTLAPQPVQSPHPPIWAGGHSEKAMARAARLADGFISIGSAPALCGVNFDWMDGAAYAHGKSALTRAVHAFLCFDESREAAAKTGERTLSQSFGFSFPIADRQAHLLGTIADCQETL